MLGGKVLRKLVGFGLNFIWNIVIIILATNILLPLNKILYFIVTILLLSVPTLILKLNYGKREPVVEHIRYRRK